MDLVDHNNVAFADRIRLFRKINRQVCVRINLG